MTTRRTEFPHDCPYPDCDERFSEPGLVAEHVELFHDGEEIARDRDGGANANGDDVGEPTPAP